MKLVCSWQGYEAKMLLEKEAEKPTRERPVTASHLLTDDQFCGLWDSQVQDDFVFTET